MHAQEYITNKLQKQLMRLATEKQTLQLEKSDLQRQVRQPSCMVRGGEVCTLRAQATADMHALHQAACIARCGQQQQHTGCS